MVEMRNVIKNVRDLLNDNVSEQFVFPKLYIYLNQKDTKHLEALSNCESYHELIKKENITTRLEEYTTNLQKVFDNTKHIATLFNVPHFDLFQFVMDDEALFLAFLNANSQVIDKLKEEVKSNTKTKEKALEEFTGLKQDQINFEYLAQLYRSE